MPENAGGAQNLLASIQMMIGMMMIRHGEAHVGHVNNICTRPVVTQSARRRYMILSCIHMLNIVLIFYVIKRSVHVCEHICVSVGVCARLTHIFLLHPFIFY